MIRFLFPFISGVCWCWRGWSFPKAIHGYYRSLVTSFVIIGAYCLCVPTMSVFSVQGLLAILCLAVLEGMLGYGSTTEIIDRVYKNKKVNYLLIEDEAKEPLNYLGFVGMAYYLFPYMILQPDKPIWVYILIAVLGFRIFPLAKLAQLKSYNMIVSTQVISIPIIKRDINISRKLYWMFCDPWKICEFAIGTGFGIWLMGV